MVAPELAAPGAALTLDAEAAHHLVRVCRAREGDRVTLTDGRGAVATGEVVATRPAAVIAIEARHALARPAARVLLAGVPEGERADWLIEKAVEFGLTALWPVDTERASWQRAGVKRERWDRLARAALGQSRRAWLPELADPVPLAAALERLGAGSQGWLADPAGGAAGAVRLDPAGSHAALVGPAPGLSEAERGLAVARGFQAISLADGRLRAETACLAVMAWWSAAAPPKPSGLF